MSRFDHYFQMNVDDVIEYTLEKAGEIPWDRDSMEAVVPPSHGNLNYVYRVWDGKGHSIYIKQPGIRNPYAGGPVRARHGATCVLF